MEERRGENREGERAANPTVMPYPREHLLHALGTGTGRWDTDTVLG